MPTLPAPCFLTDDDGTRVAGTLLAWRRDGDTWRAFVRVTSPPPDGYVFAPCVVDPAARDALTGQLFTWLRRHPAEAVESRG